MLGSSRELGRASGAWLFRVKSSKREDCLSFKKRNSMRVLLHHSGSGYTAQIDEGKVDKSIISGMEQERIKKNK